MRPEILVLVGVLIPFVVGSIGMIRLFYLHGFRNLNLNEHRLDISPFIKVALAVIMGCWIIAAFYVRDHQVKDANVALFLVGTSGIVSVLSLVVLIKNWGKRGNGSFPE